MLSYHSDPAIKDKYLNRVIAHRKADEIEKGVYWDYGKGCAVGCTIHGSDHSKYETELGIPRILARLEDSIFENLPNNRAKLWPEQFLLAINPGVDLSSVWPSFAIWLLTDKTHGVIQYAKTHQQKKSIQQVADLYLNYKNVTQKEWADAAAYAAAYAAAATAAYAAAATAAYAAAYAAAAYADDAAYAAAYAADAAYATATAAYAVAYAAAARKKQRIAQAEKLLELLKDCK